MARIRRRRVRRAIGSKLFVFLLVLTTIGPGVRAQEEGSRTRRVLDDGTTIIHTFDESHVLIREDIILRSGRHKATYFDAEGNPRYGVVTTGTGAFGLMYYDQADAPLFKFWDYGNNDTIIQLYSTDLEPIGRVRLAVSGGDRTAVWETEERRFVARVLFPAIVCVCGILLGLFFGVRIGRRAHTE